MNTEDCIEKDADVAKQQLNRIAGNSTPVPLEAGVQHELSHGEHSASHVKKTGPNFPSRGRFVLVIQVHLWHILHNGDQELDVRERVNLVSVSVTGPLGTSTILILVPRWTILLGSQIFVLTTSIQAHDEASYPPSGLCDNTMPTTTTGARTHAHQMSAIDLLIRWERPT